MKKSLIAITVLAAVFTACKKESKDLSGPSSVTTSAVSVSAQTVTPGTKRVLGIIKVKAPNANQLQYGFDVSVSGTVQATQIRNIYFVAKRTADSVVSETRPTAANVAFNWMNATSGSEYTVTFYGDITTGAAGQFSLIVRVWYRDANSDQNGNYVADVTCSIITVQLYASQPTFDWHELTGVIKDSTPMVMYEFMITNKGTQRISIAQFALQVNINDVAQDDTITAYDLVWLHNGVAAGTAKFSNSNGAVVTSFPEGNNKYYVSYASGSRELGLDPGESVTVGLKFSLRGLDHDGNGISIQLLSDANQISAGYLTLLNVTSPVVRISTTQSGSTGTVYNLTWSPNGPSHSAIPGSSSSTWVNGATINSLSVQNWHQ